MIGSATITHPGGTMRLLLFLALAGCTLDDDTASTDPPGETGETGETDTPRDCAPADADPEPTPEGHPSDGWRWTKQGALFEDSESLSYGEGDLAPCLVDTGDGLHLVFTRQRGLDQDLWVSTSDDGVSWTDPVAATGLPEGSAGYSALAWRQDAYALWYGSGTIEWARSTDGVAFEPQGTALSPGDGQLSLLYPAITALGDSLWLHHSAFDGATYSIQIAASEGLGTDFTDPVTVLEASPSSWDNAAVAQPASAIHGQDWNLWYGGYDTSLTNPGPWRVGLAVGTAWSDPVSIGVSLPLSETGPDAWSTRDPTVIPWGDGWLMIYIGMGDDGIYRLMSATSDVCN